MLRIFLAILGLLAVVLVVRFVHLSSTSQPPRALAEHGGRLAPCPRTPNCVSSHAERPGQRIDPIKVEGDPIRAFERAESAVRAMPRSRIVTAAEGYLHAEYTSAIFRFVDDLELVYDSALPGFQVRSASRVGRSDLGVNRRRVEALRALLR